MIEQVMKVFNKFFDMENKKHIKEKTEALQWALDKANIILIIKMLRYRLY